MQNYERLIIESLPGDTPREKYEKLKALQDVLTQVCYPRRGTEEWAWSIYEAIEKITPHFFTHEEVVNKT